MTDYESYPHQRRPEGGLPSIEPQTRTDATERSALGGTAVSLGEISQNPEHRMPDRTPDDSAADLKQRIISLKQIERDGLRPIQGAWGGVWHDILAPTDEVAPNGGYTTFDKIISQHPTARFLKLDDASHRGYVDGAKSKN